MNKRAIEILNLMLKTTGSDYENVKLSNEEYNYIYFKCAEIEKYKDDELIWDKVEETLNSIIIDLGYEFNDNNYKWYLPAKEC